MECLARKMAPISPSPSLASTIQSPMRSAGRNMAYSNVQYSFPWPEEGCLSTRSCAAAASAAIARLKGSPAIREGNVQITESS